MLSTWGFGCAHGLVRGSLSWESWKTGGRLFCCNPPFPQGISSESSGSPLLQPAWLGRSPPISFTLHLLCQWGGLYATILLALHLLCSSNHPLSDAQTEVHQVSWCTVQSPVLGYESLKSCKLKGKQKRNNSHSHDADISLSVCFKAIFA